ncbi:MAG: hypothetical protein AB8B55_03550 [Mariniblastus sp.]
MKHGLNARTATTLRKARRVKRHLLILATISFSLLFTALLATETLAQATQSTRQNPAPWRPAFGQVNRDTLQQSLQTPNISASAANRPTTNQPAAADQTPTIGDQSNDRTAMNPASQSGSTPTFKAAETSPPQTNKQQTPGVTRVTKTLDKLPNTAGQVWREYDITPYTSEITTTAEPQKAITEWVLRETGTEMWFSQPLGILNADKERLIVYHTPEIQAVIKKIVDRFNRTRGQVQNVDVNLVTVGKPNWRAQSYTMLQPIDVKSPGVEAWMISKENAAILLSQLSRRGDFKQHSGGRLTNHDGQSFALEKTQPVQFIRNLRWVPNQIPNYQPMLSTLNEGYKLNISCLSGMDNRSIEAVIKCDVDQVEQLDTVKVNVPGIGGAAQQMNLQIPQLVSWRLHERFRWPNDQVLLLSCGVVATPEPDSRSGGIRLPGLGKKSKRADALMFIEYRGPATGAMIPQTAAALAPIRKRN